MLVLQRHLRQSIFIGKHKEIQVKVLCVHDGLVTLGIDAPRNIPVFRHQRDESDSQLAKKNMEG